MSNIKVENIKFSYDSELVLEDINMEIEFGDFVCLLGQSGCGKSTFLRLLAGLSKPNQGHISIKGETIKGAGLDRGVVFQDYSLFPWLSTEQNIILSLKQKFKNDSIKTLRERALTHIEKVGLEQSVMLKYPNELSGGMKQRIAICRSFALDPPILLMDEPFGALDAVTRARLQDLILDLWRKESRNKKTIFFVTHDVDEAILLSTKLYVFGSSPSTIIYKHDFEDSFRKRETLFEDKEMINLRNKLINILNKDIEKKLSEGK